MSWDDAIYALITAIVIAFMAWLLLMPAPGHEPLIRFEHARLEAAAR